MKRIFTFIVILGGLCLANAQEKLGDKNMNPKYLSFLSLFIIIFFCFSCKESDKIMDNNENIPIRSSLNECVFDNPLTDLQWLNEIVNNRIQNPGASMKIFQCTYNDSTVGFYIEPCGECIRYTAALYSCDGKTLDSIKPGQYADYLNNEWNVKNKELIWTNR